MMANDYENRMLRVQACIHDQPAGDMSLDTLADIAALSRFHFQHAYRLPTGETATQAVKRTASACAALRWPCFGPFPEPEIHARLAMFCS